MCILFPANGLFYVQAFGAVTYRVVMPAFIQNSVAEKVADLSLEGKMV